MLILAGAKLIAPDDEELRAASREVRGHGLTLQLLGRYLRLVEDGDIRKGDTVRLADADEQYQNDATRPYGHAFKAMAGKTGRYLAGYARNGRSRQGTGKFQDSALLVGPQSVAVAGGALFQ